jgi:hypothetical protein
MTLLEKYQKSANDYRKSISFSKISLACLSFFLLLIIVKYFPCKSVEQHSELLNSFISFCLLIVTAIYVYLTRQMLVEMKNSRIRDNAPIILASIKKERILFDENRSNKMDYYGNRFRGELKTTNLSNFPIYNLSIEIIMPYGYNEQKSDIDYFRLDQGIIKNPDELLPKESFVGSFDTYGLVLFRNNENPQTEIDQIELTITYEDSKRNYYLLKQFYGIIYYRDSAKFGLSLILDELKMVTSETRKSIHTPFPSNLKQFFDVKFQPLYSYSYKEAVL